VPQLHEGSSICGQAEGEEVTREEATVRVLERILRLMSISKKGASIEELTEEQMEGLVDNELRLFG
jgi:hypothetical protein